MVFSKLRSWIVGGDGEEHVGLGDEDDETEDEEIYIGLSTETKYEPRDITGSTTFTVDLLAFPEKTFVVEYEKKEGSPMVRYESFDGFESVDNRAISSYNIGSYLRRTGRSTISTFNHDRLLYRRTLGRYTIKAHQHVVTKDTYRVIDDERVARRALDRDTIGHHVDLPVIGNEAVVHDAFWGMNTDRFVRIDGLGFAKRESSMIDTEFAPIQTEKSSTADEIISESVKSDEYPITVLYADGRRETIHWSR